MFKKFLSMALSLLMIISVIAIPISVGAEGDDSLRLQYLLNEDTSDSQSGGFDATVVGDVEYVTDSKFGRVIDLGGSGYLKIPGEAFTTGKKLDNITFATWISLPSWQWDPYLLDLGTDRNNHFWYHPNKQYTDGWGTSGGFTYGGQTAYVQAADTYSPWSGRGWFHVAVTVDSLAQTLTYYLNGEPIATTNCTYKFSDIINYEDASKNNYYIGRSITSSRAILDAKLYDLRIYDEAIDSAGLKAIMDEAFTDETTLNNALYGIELGDIDNRTENFVLPSTSFGATITWESSNNDLVNAQTGVVTRPHYTNENEYETAVLTATATYNGLTGTKEYVVNVPRMETPDESVNIAYDALEITGLDLAGYAVKDLELPSKGELDTDISWSSNNPDVISNDGKVTRPAENTVVELTATITKENASKEKVFAINVLSANLEGVVMSINDIPNTFTRTGVPIDLPETVRGRLSSGNYADIPVTWNVPEDYYETAGTYTITGTVENAYNDDVIASIVVNVYEYVISAVPSISLSAENPEDIPALPDEVTVVMSNGKLPSEKRKVTWDEYDINDLGENSSMIVYGTVEGTDIRAEAKLSTIVTARPVYFNQVKVHDSFWSEILKRDILVTIPHCVEQVEAQGGGWDSFLEIAKKRDGLEYSTAASGTMVFQDSDVHKTVEAMSIALEIDPQGDEEIIAGQEWIKNKLNEWIPYIVKAQVTEGEDAGYLNAWYELACDRGEKRRWSNYSDHELYVAGHFIESAVSHYRAFNGTDTRLYDVAIKLADYLCNKFEYLNEIPGHEEIELALVKLGNLRNEIMQDGSGDRYVNMAKIFINRRGTGRNTRPSRYSGGTYSQDNVTIQEATEAVGHSVRFGYYMMAVTDIAMNDGDEEYIASLNKLWRSCVDTKMYITGATGTTGNGSDSEGFGPAYYLPDDAAYAESCATVSNMKWAQRMNQLNGDSEYVDVMERVLYNGFLHSISVTGDRYFYTNPLQGRATRSEWFACACCPPNIARTIASVSEYAYVVKGSELRANTFIGSTANVTVDGKPFVIETETDYPYDGAIKFTFTTQEENQHMKFKVRIPSWNTGYTIAINGETVENPVIEQGYIVFDRQWNTGDYIEYNLAMDIVRVYEDENVEFAQGKVAFTRGPIVYSFETNDNPSDVTLTNAVIPENATFTADEHIDPVLGHLITISTSYAKASANADEYTKLTAIPYYLTHNRGGSIVTHMLEGEAVDDVVTTLDGLNNLIDEARALKEADYTPDSWVGFAETLKAYEVFYGDETLSSEQIIGIASELQSAINDLVDIGTLLYSIESINGEEPNDDICVDVNEPVSVVLRTDLSVENIYLQNEYGSDIGRTIINVESTDEYIEWEVVFAVGSKGVRDINVCGSVDGKIYDLKGDVRINVGFREAEVNPDIPKTLISADAGKGPAFVNQPFTVTIVTSSTVQQVGIFNEYGLDIGKSLVSVETDGDTTTWVYNIAVGSKGLRNFTVKIADYDGVWFDDQSITFKKSIIK